MTGDKPEDIETDRQRRSVSPYKAGFNCVCPACAGAPLFDNLLEVKATCPACGFDLSEADPGDGAQVFVIFVLGALSALLGILLYVFVGMPIWLLALLLGLFVLGGSIWMLRVFKATLIALQFKHEAQEGRLIAKDSSDD